VAQTYNILIVDDSGTTRAMIKRIIQMTDLPVAGLKEAVDGQDAWRLLQAASVDDIQLVMTDINMPNMDGLQLTRQIRQDTKFGLIPIVVVTARPDDEITEQFKHAQVQGWLTKPFTPEKVRDVVMSALSCTVGTGGSNA
jgi:two-component system chemotaxis response regulator CheY